MAHCRGDWEGAYFFYLDGFLCGTTLRNGPYLSFNSMLTHISCLFPAAALSITTLYRSSRKNAKKAYNSGYAQACQDMLNFIQQGVSASSTLGFPDESQASPSSTVDGGGMTIGRVMDFTEARLDAIKALEEDEDEDEEKEAPKQSKPKAGPSAAVGVAPAGAVASTLGTSKTGVGDAKPVSRSTSKTMVRPAS